MTFQLHSFYVLKNAMFDLKGLIFFFYKYIYTIVMYSAGQKVIQFNIKKKKKKALEDYANRFH